MGREKVYDASIRDIIYGCEKEDDVRSVLLEACAKLEPSRQTKRKWIKAGEDRIGFLRSRQLVLAAPRLQAA